MKKSLLTAALLLTVTALAQTSGVLTIGSGSTTGVYYPVAVGMAKLAGEDGIKATVVASKGSAANLESLAAGDQQISLAQSDIAYYAYRGTGIPAFDNKPNTKLRTIATLYPEVIHVLVRRDAEINSIKDLKGKRVVVGDAGSGTEQNSRQVLEAFDLNFSDLKETIRVSPTVGIEMVDANKADALVYTVGLGANAIVQVTNKKDMKLLPVAGFNARKMMTKYPFYVRFNVPRGTYKGVTTTVPTVAVQASLMTTTDQSEDTIYRFLKSTIKDQAAFKTIHPNLQNYFSYDRATKGLPAPMHPGAIKFFKEQGISVR